VKCVLAIFGSRRSRTPQRWTTAHAPAGTERPSEAQSSLALQHRPESETDTLDIRPNPRSIEVESPFRFSLRTGKHQEPPIPKAALLFHPLFAEFCLARASTKTRAISLVGIIVRPKIRQLDTLPVCAQNLHVYLENSDRDSASTKVANEVATGLLVTIRRIGAACAVESFVLAAIIFRSYSVLADKKVSGQTKIRHAVARSRQLAWFQMLDKSTYCIIFFTLVTLVIREKIARRAADSEECRRRWRSETGFTSAIHDGSQG